MTLVLGIETSCDETAVALVDDAVHVRSSIVASQVDLHARFGGVVPELASRAHVELILPVLADALGEAQVSLAEVDLIAGTHGPGLVGALLVGVSAAKSLALVTGVPYVGVNHLEAHLHAPWLERPDLEAPCAVLLVSGGHTMLVVVDAPGQYRVVGQTVDDAAGEAFDKVARHLGLGYPGGPQIDRIAREGDPTAVRFPRPMRGDGFDFSFSGLKTAVVTHRRMAPDQPVADVAASFQEAAVDVLAEKLAALGREVGAKALVLGGGVAANTRLRARVASEAEALGVPALLPALEYCTDNAAMIAAAGYHRFRVDGPTGLDDGAHPSLRLA